jgi:HAD superfamily hydrolase (TIGR01509 family)
MAVDAILFDFDGVIIDTETPDFELWREFYYTKGFDLPVDLWISRVGENENESFDPGKYYEQLSGNPMDSAFKQNFIARYTERCAQQPLLPGVQAMFDQATLRGIKLAIASSAYRPWVERWLQQHNLRQYFACLCTREDVQKGKPAPDLYLSAAACLNVPIERCIAIEDSPNGMKAALAAGLRCIAVPNTLTIRLKRPEVALTVNSLAEFDLPKLLAQF